MAYFASYIDGNGLHMPSYDDRLAELWARYCEIFGVDPALSASAPDYQLLAAFARRLDDVSSLIRQAYESRNPLAASGHGLDLLLPQYGLIRNPGEADENCRRRMLPSTAARGGCSLDSLDAALRSVTNGKFNLKYRLYVNDGDTADANGIPSHSVALVTYNGVAGKLAQALFDHVAPGIGTYGSTAATAYDRDGGAHTVFFSRAAYNSLTVNAFVYKLPGADEAAISEAVVTSIMGFVDGLEIGGTLNIPQLYGVANSADPAIANTYVVSDIQVSVPGVDHVVRDIVQCAWNQVFFIGTQAYPAVHVYFSN